jgi:hypothetical protein
MREEIKRVKEENIFTALAIKYLELKDKHEELVASVQANAKDRTPEK